MARFNNGWIKLWRRASEGDLADNVYLWGLWNWLLHSATWKQTSVIWQGKRRDIPAGSVVFGITELAEKWECSKSTISKWLRYLELSERIAIDTCPRGTLVTILNWDVYQSHATQEQTNCERSANTERTPREHGANLIEEYKKEEDILEPRKSASRAGPKFDLEALYQLYPRKKGKTPGLKKLSREITSETDYEDLRLAIQNYSLEVQGRQPEHIAYFSTFVSQWRDWVHPEPDTVSYSINTTPLNLEEIR